MMMSSGNKFVATHAKVKKPIPNTEAGANRTPRRLVGNGINGIMTFTKGNQYGALHSMPTISGASLYVFRLSNAKA